MDNGKEHGMVKWFNDRRGYGFISRGGEAPDVFVHYSEIQQDQGRKTLKEGQEVEFRVIKDGKGLKATKVLVLGPPARA